MVSPDFWLGKLQRLQNAAAQLVVGCPKYCHITPILITINLHWLPVRQRIAFKICMFMYKCLHNLAPVYLTELCVSRQTNRGWPAVRKQKTYWRPQKSTPSNTKSVLLLMLGLQFGNRLSASLRGHDLTLSAFKHDLKTFFV